MAQDWPASSLGGASTGDAPGTWRGRPLSAPAMSPWAVVRFMMSINPVMQHLGMRVTDVAPGRSELAMPVRPDMGNTYGVCHGGIVFSFADMCFGLAANAGDVRAVTASAEIHFVAPVPIGTELLGVGHEVWRRGRTTLIDVTLSDPAGTTLALMRARGRIFDERVVPADWTDPEAAAPDG